jgi:hypothetical protein
MRFVRRRTAPPCRRNQRRKWLGKRAIPAFRRFYRNLQSGIIIKKSPSSIKNQEDLVPSRKRHRGRLICEYPPERHFITLYSISFSHSRFETV